MGNWLQSVFHPVVSLVTAIPRSRSRDRQEQNYENYLATQQQLEAKAAGDVEMEKYKSGRLTKGQKAKIEKDTAIQKAQLMQSLASSGMQNSSTAAVERGNIAGFAAQEKQTFVEQHYLNAMQAYGLSDQIQASLHKMHLENMQENIQIYAGLMSILGGAVGTWLGGSGQDKKPTISATVGPATVSNPTTGYEPSISVSA